jgi:hypothetical protein
MTIPPLRCEHPTDGIAQRSFRAVCGACGSFWDRDSLARSIRYDPDYPERRGHYDPRVGALKVRTLRRWLANANVALDGRVVCEVGFGGGSCLPLLAERARRVLGIEANAATVEHVRASGVRADLLLVDTLPPRLDEPVDLWLFQDSFEHVPNPTPFVDWIVANSSPTAEVFVVAPRGDSLSCQLMGRLWPHKLPDHDFHWSRAGLVQFMARRGFVPRAEFYPLKFASPQMVAAHLFHKLGAPEGVRRWLGGASLAVPFNFGEMGLVFRRALADSPSSAAREAPAGG